MQYCQLVKKSRFGEFYIKFILHICKIYMQNTFVFEKWHSLYNTKEWMLEWG